MNQFSSDQYWKDQREVMDRYENLIQDLLSLSNEKLNEFVAEIPNQQWSGQETIELQQWFVDNGHLTKVPQEYQWGDPSHEGAWMIGTYPVDILLLTHRIGQDYPDWTPRKFLAEAKKFSYTVKTKLPR